MIATMKAHEGVGLAAPQIGASLNLIVLGVPMPTEPEDIGFLSPGERMLLPRMPLALVNTHLSSFSEDTETRTEGCLSIPNVSAEVTRPENVMISAHDLDGIQIQFPCGGLLGRCIQHEWDHVNGVLFVDRLSPEERKPLEDNLKRLDKETQRALKQ